MSSARQSVLAKQQLNTTHAVVQIQLLNIYIYHVPLQKYSIDEGVESIPACPGWERTQLAMKQVKKDERERCGFEEG